MPSDKTQVAKPGFAFPIGVYCREVDGQMVLLERESERYFGLDEVGTEVVKRLTEQSLAQAITALAELYDVDMGVLERDVNHLIDTLLEARLLERRDGTA